MTNKELKFLILIFIILIAACIETDIYLPAFPDMMKYFSVSEDAIQSLLSWNFLGVCISCPIYGPISDSFGRRKPLIVALVLFMIGSAITVIADDFSFMLIGRLFQGLGSGGCFTLGTAIIFDAFSAQRAVIAVNFLNASIPITMGLAPLAGGYLNYFFGFRSNFLVIGVLVFASFLLTLVSLEETLVPEKRAPFKAKKILADFKAALTNLHFWQLTMVISLLFAGYLAFVSASAVLFVVEFGISKTMFPLFQLAILGSYVVASLSCSRLVTKYGTAKVKKVSVVLIAAGTVGLLAAAALAPKSALILTLAMLPYGAGCSYLMGLYFPEAMDILPDIKGVTSGLLTSLRLLMTAVLVEISSELYNGTIYPVVAVVAAAMFVTIPTILHYEGRKSLMEIDPTCPS